jgi:predicted DNA-binding transcriptional regulator AlpA
MLPLLTQREAADFLQLSVRTLERYRVSGGGPEYVQISRRCVRYRPEDLNAWVELRRRRNTSAAAIPLLKAV